MKGKGDEPLETIIELASGFAACASLTAQYSAKMMGRANTLASPLDPKAFRRVRDLPKAHVRLQCMRHSTRPSVLRPGMPSPLAEVMKGVIKQTGIPVAVPSSVSSRRQSFMRSPGGLVYGKTCKSFPAAFSGRSNADVLLVAGDRMTCRGENGKS